MHLHNVLISERRPVASMVTKSTDEDILEPHSLPGSQGLLSYEVNMLRIEERTCRPWFVEIGTHSDSTKE
jgi:hypothetical protein